MNTMETNMIANRMKPVVAIAVIGILGTANIQRATANPTKRYTVSTLKVLYQKGNRFFRSRKDLNEEKIRSGQ
jgi:hypothetical protein